MIATGLLLLMALGLVSMMVLHLLVLIVRVLAIAVRAMLHDARRSFKIPRPVALPVRAFSSKEVLYSWEDWHRDARAMYPVRYFLGESIPRFIRRQLGKPLHAWNWLRCHTFSRYHLLDLRNPEYAWGYLDGPEAMLYASFSVLKAYVENERGIDSVVSDEMSDEQKEIEYEVQALYIWWTDLRWDELERIRRLWRSAKSRDERNRVHELKEQAAERDQVNLLRLMNVRLHLWT
jgi:hypothetical protein